MNSTTDSVTRALSRAVDLLTIRYPVRTSLGVVIGAFIFFVATFLGPFLVQYIALDFAKAPVWGCISLGILIAHGRTLKDSFVNSQVGNEQFDKALALIEAGNFSPAEKRQHFRALIQKALDQIPVDASFSEQIAHGRRAIESQHDPES